MGETLIVTRSARLDLLGGIAGDMFAAAMLSALPDLERPLREEMRVLEAIGLSAFRLERRHDGVFDALHLDLDGPSRHEHRNWSDIRQLLNTLDIERPVRDRALAMFTLIAEAEAKVHARPLDDVHFHEVGAWDSIADILMAAWLIEHSGVTAWSTGPVPLGGGQVRTRHGPMPVPAPATTLLLEGFELVDDGVPGERVTPTGAAILRHLCQPGGKARGRIVAQGAGRGTMELPGRANILRVLLMDTADADSTHREQLREIAFEIDDQSGEDLALALDRLRGLDGVRDALQIPAFGKKGRMTVAVRLLVEPRYCEKVAQACFRETTTLGLRMAEVERLVLPREQHGDVKLARRPGGEISGKAEADSLTAGSAFARSRERFGKVERAIARNDGERDRP